MKRQTIDGGDRREVFGWAMYDWANSAFSTTIGTVFLGPYLASLAAQAAKVNPDGMARLLGMPIAPDSFMPYCVSLSVGLQVLFLPILGAIADYSHLRKSMMRAFAMLGAAAAALFFVSGQLWWLGGLLFIVANLFFGASAVFYNSFLPDIAAEEDRDRVSSYGWAMGYLEASFSSSTSSSTNSAAPSACRPALRFASTSRRRGCGGSAFPSSPRPGCARGGRAATCPRARAT